MSEEENIPNRLESAPPKWIGPHGHRWFSPHVIFVHNRCRPEDFSPARIEFLQVRWVQVFAWWENYPETFAQVGNECFLRDLPYQESYQPLLRGSDLRTHTGFNVASCFPYLKTANKETTFNFFLMPDVQGKAIPNRVQWRDEVEKFCQIAINAVYWYLFYTSVWFFIRLRPEG